MTWDWYDLEKRTGSSNLRQRTPAQQKEADKKNKELAEKQALERELQNITGRKDAIFDIKGRATNEKIRAKIEEERRLNQEAVGRGRKAERKEIRDKAIAGTKAGAKAGAKAVQDTAVATARGIGQAGVNVIDRELSKPKASKAEQEKRFQYFKERAERAKRPINYKAIEERRRRAFKDGRDPKLYYNKKGQPVAPVAQAAKDAGRVIAGKTVAAGKKALGAGKRTIAAPFKSGSAMVSQLFTGGKRVSSVHPSIEYDSQGRRNPNYDPKQAERKKRESQKTNPKTGKTSSNTGVLANKPPPPPPPPQPKKELPPKVKEQLKKPKEQTTNPDFV